jgi:hypothetical protein
VFLAPILVFAQQQDHAGMKHDAMNAIQANIIDGSTNPELISDAVARWLFFRAVSEPPSPTAEERARQRAKLALLLLNEKEFQVFTGILASFHVQAVNLEIRHATAAKTGSTTPEAFAAEQDALANNTMEALRGALNPSAFEALAKHIQGEKKRMKGVSTTPVGGK